MIITRFGHAALLVETSATRILIDPGTFSPDETFELRELAAIVITHQHADHQDATRLPGLLAANPDAVLIADPQSVPLQSHGSWLANHADREFTVGAMTLRGVGSRHAEITPQVPRVDNVGIAVVATGEPTLFHPGDAYEYTPAGVDVLALPLGAPWAKLSETIDFLQRVNPNSYFPIHDGTIAERAYASYWDRTEQFGGVADAHRLGPRDHLEL